MEAMLGAAQSDRPGRRAYAETLGAALLQHLAWWADTGPDEPTADDSILGELLVWIDAHLAQKLSLDEMAERVHMSRALFTRRFRSAIGLSPHQYLTRRRVDMAQRLLGEPEHDLAWIAQETGFSNPSHFTAWFRALTGETPGRYRERV